MLLESTLGYKSSWRILTLLLETPRKPVSRKELLRYTRLGNAPLSKGLERLTQTGLIYKETRGKTAYYFMNYHHPYFHTVSELQQIEQKKTRHLDYEIKIILGEFMRKAHEYVEKAILFGSWAKGTASQDSDIDLAIVPKNEMEITRIIEELDKQFGKQIQAHYFTELENKSKLTAEIHRDGIIVS